MIVALIVILVAAVFIERKCSSENVDPTTQKEINEYVEKAKKTKVKDKKDSKKTSSSSKSKSQSKKSNSSNKSTSKSKSNSKKSTKKDNKSSKGKTSKSKKSSSPNRLLDPVPQF